MGELAVDPLLCQVSGNVDRPRYDLPRIKLQFEPSHLIDGIFEDFRGISSGYWRV